MTGGSIFFPRHVLTMTELWQNPFAHRLFIHIVTNAVFKDGVEVGGVVLNRGQYLRSFRKLQDDLSYKEKLREIKPSTAEIHRKVKDLVELGLIEIGTGVSSQFGTLFQVVKYEQYQGFQLIENRSLERGLEHPLEQKEIRYLKNKGIKEINIDDDDRQKKSFENYYDTFVTVYGRQPTPVQLERLQDYLREIEEPALIMALKIATTASGNFNYLTAILNKWVNNGIKTVQQAEQAEQERKKQKNIPPQERGGRRAKVREHYDISELNLEY